MTEAVVKAKKWNKGDKVRVVVPGWKNGANGEFGTVVGFSKNGDVRVQVGTRRQPNSINPEHLVSVGEPRTSEDARGWLHAQVKTDTTALGAALANAQADGYSAAALGLAASGEVAQPIPVAVTGQAENQTLKQYWDAWKPGDVKAADLLHNHGFQNLLVDQHVTIKGIADTTLDRMGTLLAQGAEAGWSVDKIANAMSDLLEDPSRAYGIADTELARAVSAATAETFEANGIGEWDWLTSDGACEECIAEEDSNPHSLGDMQPPAHPTCRCAMSPRSRLSG